MRSQSGNRQSIGTLAIAAALLAAISTGAESAQAWTLKTLYSFCAQPNCADGSQPNWGPLLMDQAGNLYGVTGLGGASNRGTVFTLYREGDGWTQQLLYTFCAQASCADGAIPGGNLIMDIAGNLYGMTQAGGSIDGGVVYELSPSGNGNPWTQRLLHLFCSLPACADGQDPTAAGLTYSGEATGAPFDGVSPLYGTTYNGGAHDYGAVFELQRDRASKQWTEVVLTSFCRKYRCTYASPSFGNLLRDAAGNLIGTTATFASDCRQEKLHGSCGKVFEIVPNGTASRFRRLYDFCSMPDCTDGQAPTGSLVADNLGNLYGTTERGGANGSGVVFKLTGSTLEVLYSFCAQPNCADGALPLAGVVLDASGNLFGATSFGGENGKGGTVFELSP
jgi:uncharacterized repeat protein (TIGR03803 family)